jgi:hypothetical protein
MTRASDTARTLSGGAVFNEAGADVDFRVESDDNANMLVVNAGDDIVGIGTATQGRETNLAVVGTDQLPTGAWSQFGIYSNDSYAINKGGSMMFGGQDGSVARQLFSAIKGAKENSTSGNYAGYLAFYTRPSGDTPIEAIRIHSNQVVSASAGVALGVGTANTASNVLDDYEEGTWTPTIGNFTVNSGTWGATGRYIKIGNSVTVSMFQTGGNVTWSTSQQLGGLPFAPIASLYGAGTWTNSSPNAGGQVFMYHTASTFYFAQGGSSITDLVVTATYILT